MVEIEQYAKEHGLKLATSVWEFVDVDLYSEEKYSRKKMDFWMWSPHLKRVDKRELCEGHSWRVLKEYVENKLIYIKK